MIFQPNLIVNIVEPPMDSVEFGNGNPFPYTTHQIGRFKYPLTTSGNSSVFTAHYSKEKEPFSGPVKKLTLNQLGNPTAPNMCFYSSTCEIIEFNGYINTARTAFEVINQLPICTKVEFFIGAAQQSYLNEFKAKTPVCPGVKTLKIVMDLDYFHSFHHICNNGVSQSHCIKVGSCLNSIQQSHIFLIESLLKHAGESFPNLKNLDVDLPENDRLCNAVKSLIKVSRGLREKTQTKLRNALPSKKTLELQSLENQEPSRAHYSWTSSGTSSGNSPVEPMPSPHLMQPLLPSLSNTNIDMAAFGQNSNYETMSPSSSGSHSNSNISPPQQSHVINHRPPPGFAPLRVKTQGAYIPPGFQETDKQQRVHSWLESVENSSTHN